MEANDREELVKTDNSKEWMNFITVQVRERERVDNVDKACLTCPKR